MNNSQMDRTQRIKAMDPGMATGKAKELLDDVVKKYGGAPNSFKSMAHSPAAFQAFSIFPERLKAAYCPSRLDTKSP